MYQLYVVRWWLVRWRHNTLAGRAVSSQIDAIDISGKGPDWELCLRWDIIGNYDNNSRCRYARWQQCKQILLATCNYNPWYLLITDIYGGSGCAVSSFVAGPPCKPHFSKPTWHFLLHCRNFVSGLRRSNLP